MIHFGTTETTSKCDEEVSKMRRENAFY